jgi:hypothetical protein
VVRHEEPTAGLCSDSCGRRCWARQHWGSLAASAEQLRLPRVAKACSLARMAGLRVGTLVVAAAVLPFADAFTVPSGTLSSLRRGSPLLCPRPFRSGLELGHQQQQQQLSPVGSNQRKERRVGANMVIGVVSALTGPVVALAALGTLGGLGRVVRNMPRYMELQYKYAMQLLAQGGLEPVTDVDKLKQGILDSKEYRYNVLKLFVKYDQDDDGKVVSASAGASGDVGSQVAMMRGPDGR